MQPAVGGPLDLQSNALLAISYGTAGADPLAALDELLAVRQQQAAAAAATQADAALHHRQQWLHVGERPSPQLTAMVRPPTGSSTILARRAPNGRLASTPSQCAQVSVQHWAAMSGPQPTDAAAQQEVLVAMADAPRLPPSAALDLGRSAMSSAEIKAALRRTCLPTCTAALSPSSSPPLPPVLCHWRHRLPAPWLP